MSTYKQLQARAKAAGIKANQKAHVLETLLRNWTEDRVMESPEPRRRRPETVPASPASVSRQAAAEPQSSIADLACHVAECVLGAEAFQLGLRVLASLGVAAAVLVVAYVIGAERLSDFGKWFVLIAVKQAIAYATAWILAMQATAFLALLGVAAAVLVVAYVIGAFTAETLSDFGKWFVPFAVKQAIAYARAWILTMQAIAFLTLLAYGGWHAICNFMSYPSKSRQKFVDTVIPWVKIAVFWLTVGPFILVKKAGSHLWANKRQAVAWLLCKLKQKARDTIWPPTEEELKERTTQQKKEARERSALAKEKEEHRLKLAEEKVAHNMALQWARENQEAALSQLKNTNIRAAAPKYWHQLDVGGTPFSELVLVRNPFMVNRLQRLLRVTPLHPGGCGPGNFGLDGATVTKVHRIENSELWNTYNHRKETMLRRFTKSSQNTQIQKVHVAHHKTIDSHVNELFLFHGTTPDHVKIIAELGFDERVASLGGLSGSGCYFAENSCKSHQYTRQTNSAGEYIMLYCRVLLGAPHCTNQNLQNMSLAPNHCDSVVASGGTQVHREFIVYDRSQVYPEYVIYYKP